jgi:hypothetical protein
MITKNARRICKIKHMIVMARIALNGKKALFTSKLGLTLR